MTAKVFFVFSQYRTGSELLCSLLNSHPDITCLHESLAPSRDGKKVDWWEKANELARQYPLAKFIGVHGQANMLSEDTLNAPGKKIILSREDEVLGAVKQVLLEQRRVHNGFDLNFGFVEHCMKLRKNREKVITSEATFKLTYEQMTRGGNNINQLSPWLNWRLLKHIGADWYRLKTSLPKGKPMLPSNLEEIYNDQKGETSA
jgi:hypothetical protein